MATGRGQARFTIDMKLVQEQACPSEFIKLTVWNFRDLEF